MKWIVTVAVVGVLGVFPVGCSKSSESHDHQGHEHSSTTQKAYSCSTCGGTYDKPGQCPHCGKSLVEKK